LPIRSHAAACETLWQAQRNVRHARPDTRSACDLQIVVLEWTTPQTSDATDCSVSLSPILEFLRALVGAFHGQDDVRFAKSLEG
jgi:hypothetical protein